MYVCVSMYGLFNGWCDVLVIVRLCAYVCMFGCMYVCVNVRACVCVCMYVHA